MRGKIIDDITLLAHVFDQTNRPSEPLRAKVTIQTLKGYGLRFDDGFYWLGDHPIYPTAHASPQNQAMDLLIRLLDDKAIGLGKYQAEAVGIKAIYCERLKYQSKNQKGAKEK